MSTPTSLDPAAIADEVFASTPENAPVPGIAYGLVHDGRLVHADGRGQAILGGPSPDARTVFRIASMTKSFTAAAILMLRDDGQLRLDDPVADHVPAAHGLHRPGQPDLTIRDLLTMGAGLATDDPWGDRQESLPLEEFDALVAAGLSAVWPPRTRFEYSNTSYALLGRVVAAASGVAFTDFVLDALCRPLGMASTIFDATAVDPSLLATGYRIAADGVPVAEPLVEPGAFSAMGGLLSTVDDMARWVAGLLAAWGPEDDRHPLSRWSRREMQELARYVSTDQGTGAAQGTVVVGYGFGLQSMEHEVLGRVIAHSGGYPGYGSHMRWHPASGWGVVALGNSSYAPMHVPVAETLARIVVESGTAHGSSPMSPVVPWPQTLAAMGVAEKLLAGDESGIDEATWSPNMDLDVPRAERRTGLAAIREAIGDARRVEGSVTHPTAARAVWQVAGPTGTARVELLMTPERRPRIQKLTVTLHDPSG